MTDQPTHARCVLAELSDNAVDLAIETLMSGPEEYGLRDTLKHAIHHGALLGFNIANPRPRILILGWARHGKDTVAEMLRDNHGYDFRSSSYFLAEKVVRPGLAERGIFYSSLDECYEDRVNHRSLWRDIIAEYNGDDPALLAKSILAECDCYVGMRTDREYRAAAPLFDAIVWVDASARDIPPEGKDSMCIEFDPRVMHRIDNGGDLHDLAGEVAKFVNTIGAGAQIALPLDS